MAIKKIHIFQNSPSYIENVLDQETNELVGRCFCIVDSDTGDLYRYPMDMSISKERGQQLMGIGAVEVADSSALVRLDDRKKSGGGRRQ